MRHIVKILGIVGGFLIMSLILAGLIIVVAVMFDDMMQIKTKKQPLTIVVVKNKYRPCCNAYDCASDIPTAEHIISHEGDWSIKR